MPTYRTAFSYFNRGKRTRREVNVQASTRALDDAGRAEIAEIVATSFAVHAVDVTLHAIRGNGLEWVPDEVERPRPSAAPGKRLPTLAEIAKMSKAELLEAAPKFGIEVPDPKSKPADKLRDELIQAAQLVST